MENNSSGNKSESDGNLKSQEFIPINTKTDENGNLVIIEDEGIEIRMSDHKIVEEYIDAFRSGMASFLQGKIAQQIDVFQFEDGFLLDIKQKSFLSNTDKYWQKVDTLQNAIDLLDLKIGDQTRGDIENLKKQVSSIQKDGNDNNILFGDSIIIIKNNNQKLWTKEQASFDAQEVKNHLLFLYKQYKKNKISPKF
ncbi:MAG: hypothetical protein E2590_09170 [Chryseobacterium sp.]|nr:hypothetical protein [Chryseobacterium sp.]